MQRNPTHHYCTKHIDGLHHFIEEKLENQEIYLKYCLMKDMIVGILAKPFAKDRHQALTKEMVLKAFTCLQNNSVEGRALDCL